LFRSGTGQTGGERSAAAKDPAHDRGDDPNGAIPIDASNTCSAYIGITRLGTFQVILAVILEALKALTLDPTRLVVLGLEEDRRPGEGKA
jgi:hypothetical protein